MKQHNLTQGSTQWLAHRARHFNASDAAAMLGCSPHKSRTQLLAELHFGVSAEPGDYKQKILDSGHRIEALARPLAEVIIGEDLYPVVGTEGELSASFDGLTADESTNWECKRLNDELRAALAQPGPDENDAGALPKHYCVQMEQQLLVARATRVLFTAAEFDAADQLVDARHCWYTSDPALRAEILAGWKQFAEDLANYKHVEDAPKVTGHAPEQLPALLIQVTGAVSASNLDEFKAHALAVFGSINRELKSDEDFANAASTVGWCEEVESRLKAAKQHALAQTQSIDALFRVIDELSEKARDIRLDLDKLVTARKEAIKREQVQRGREALEAHVAGLNERIGKPYMPQQVADFAGAIKGKRTVATLRDAIDTTLATAKIAANEVADRIQVNLNMLREVAADHAFLFADTASLVLKDADACRAIATSRIAEHKAAEEKRLEAERERIRAEEALKLSLEQAQRDREAARQAAATAQSPAAAPIVAPAPVQVVANVHPIPTRAPASPVGPPTLRIGEIANRLGFGITESFLRTQLGFEPAGKDRNAVLYHESSYRPICDALIEHIAAARDQQMAA